MTFNPNTVVDPVAKYGGRRCRGWPPLAKHFGVEVRDGVVVDRCGVGDEAAVRLRRRRLREATAPRWRARARDAHRLERD